MLHRPQCASRFDVVRFMKEALEPKHAQNYYVIIVIDSTKAQLIEETTSQQSHDANQSMAFLFQLLHYCCFKWLVCSQPYMSSALWPAILGRL